MRRREFIGLVGGAAAWPFATRAQQAERVRRIGVLMAAPADDPEYQARILALMQRLQQLGWADGINVRVDMRWSPDPNDLRRHAAELAALAPDVIVAATGTTSAHGPDSTSTSTTQAASNSVKVTSADQKAPTWIGREPPVAH